MASMWQKTLFYLGLVDEDEAPAYESPARSHVEQPYQDPGGAGRVPEARPEPQRRVTPDPRTGRRVAASPGAGEELETQSGASADDAAPHACRQCSG